jgi:hypothetical protein
VGSFDDFHHGSGLDFGDLAAGSQGTTVRTVYSNTTAAPFTEDQALFALKVTQVQGPSSYAFNVISTTCVDALLLPNQSCVIKLAFTPKIWERGEVNANLTVEDSTGTHLLPLTGTALQPATLILAKPLAYVKDANTVGFAWLTSDDAQFTISITQPVVKTVKVKKGKKMVSQKVTTVKPFVIKTITNQPAGSSGDSITWDRKINGKAAVKGKWSITIVAKSARGTVTKQLPITLG